MDNLATPQMKFEEMIDTLKGLVFGTFDRTTTKERVALDMAISLLENLCEDAISRQAAIELVNTYLANDMPCDLADDIKNLPPVKPKNGFFEFIVNSMNPNEYQEYWNRYYCSSDEKGCE